MLPDGRLTGNYLFYRKIYKILAGMLFIKLPQHSLIQPPGGTPFKKPLEKSKFVLILFAWESYPANQAGPCCRENTATPAGADASPTRIQVLRTTIPINLLIW